MRSARQAVRSLFTARHQRRADSAGKLRSHAFAEIDSDQGIPLSCHAAIAPDVGTPMDTAITCTPSKAACLAGMPREIRARLESGATLLTVKRGQVLVHIGDK